MELIKTEYSQNKGNGKLDKIFVECNNPIYYKLINFLYTSHNNNALVINALYKLNINIVMKFGIMNYIEKEYSISNDLLKLPNFIKYLCMLNCYDDIKNIITNKETITDYKICNYGNNQIGILVMKYYNFGCIEKYIWNINNVDIFKNVIKQVIFAIIYAYEIKGFIHGDLHCGNILLKSKRKIQIQYGTKILALNDLQVVIMDFEKSKLYQKNKTTELIKNILKFITSIKNVCLINNLFFEIDEKKISNISSVSNVNVNINDYDYFDDIIDNSKIVVL